MNPRRSDASDADVAAARRVLETEIAGLNALAGALDTDFAAALDVLGGIEGRVIVSGMGKSGHIARKIAATMASTGTPATYVHPGEASHGDLGMLDRARDAVLVLSNSGETQELGDVVAYCRRFKIPLIAIVGRADSTLAEQADVALVIPPSPEACSIGLAPTTSTTVMLALGDCLAVALLERRGFSADDFHDLHPGGKLGSSLTKVSDIMHTGDALPLVSAETAMGETLFVMTKKGFGCVGVVSQEGRLSGIITDGDLRRHLDGLMARAAGEVMTAAPKSIRPGALGAEALGVMNASAITNLFVVEDGRPVGIVHIHDCLRAGLA